jgi:hypothetical protein
LKEQKKFDILQTIIKILDGFFIFFIMLNSVLFFMGVLFPTMPPACQLCAGCPCPPLGYVNIDHFHNVLIFGGIITFSLTIPIFVMIRLPLVYKLKTLKFALIKIKYGGNEDLLKFYREFQSGSISDNKYKNLNSPHIERR